MIRLLFLWGKVDGGAPAGAGGRFLKKAPQKLFSGGQLYIASFLAEKLCFSASPSHTEEKESELSFSSMCLGPGGFFSRDARKESTENDLDSARQWGMGEGERMRLCGLGGER